MNDENFKVILCHGLQRTDLTVKPTESLSDLQLKIEELLHIPVGGQKIICKGKSLKDHSATAVSLGIKDGDRLMVLGKAYQIESDPVYQDILKFEGYFQDQESSLQEIAKAEASQSSCKKLLQINEDLMKSLEGLDLISLEKHQTAARNQRKVLIQRIQKLMDDVDKTHEKFQSLLKSS